MSFLTKDYRRTSIKKTKPIVSAVDSYIYSLKENYSRKSIISNFLKQANHINSLSSGWSHKTDRVLRDRLLELQTVFKRRKKNYELLLPEALAAIKEAAKRSLGLDSYVVQIAGSLALYKGYIIEMATGEGKTLTAGLTAVMRGWTGLPCHIITVNDYLAERDSKFLEPLYKFCNLSVGYVTGEMDHAARKNGYNKDITYTTCKEIIADFLRDRIWLGSIQNSYRRQIKYFLMNHQKNEIEKGLVTKGIHTAIIDEADSVLIDEAVTPLIISKSQKNEAFVEACKIANTISSNLQRNIDYKVNEKFKDIEFINSRREFLNEQIKCLPALFQISNRSLELISQALIAKEFYIKDKQYIVKDKKVMIVDEFTGRLMPQRTWRAGLHQLIEAKENVSITPPSETLARLSFQKFYSFFHKLSGMTGTANESMSELWRIYRLPTVTIPPHKPCQRKIYPRLIFPDQKSKWQAIIDEIIRMNKLNRPVLVGTRNIKISEELALRLAEFNLVCNILNAVRHKEEASIISHAGKSGTITIATNMAGRGTDIKLEKNVINLGGLHVIITECHESSRIDRQLFGRSARQGDPGSARSYVSMEDELICQYILPSIWRILRNILKNDNLCINWLANKLVDFAQKSAQRSAFRHRNSVLKMDTWLDDSLSFGHNDIL